MPRMLRRLLLLAALVAVAPAAAQGGAPPNDSRQAALLLSAARGVATGTTLGSTVDETDPRRPCGREVAGTVWYRLVTVPPRQVVLRLRARGQLDAVGAVYRPRGNTLAAVYCSAAGDDGVATLGFEGRRGDLVLVGQIGTRSGSFELRALVPQPAEHAPGTPLYGSATSTVERYLDEEDYWHVTLVAGTTYRFGLVSIGDGCTDASLRSPAATDEVLSMSCDDYDLFTPGPSGGGTYVLRVEPGYSDGPQAYRLQVAVAGPDDTAPGLPLRPGGWTVGRLDPNHLDAVDLYRFGLERRSDVLLALGRPRPEQVTLELMSSNGKRIERGPAVRRSLKPGDYYVAVKESAGERAAAYRLALRVQEVSLIAVAPHEAMRGEPVVFAVRVGSPAGRFATLQIDRFDPLQGWVFYRVYRLRVAPDDTATLTWSPPGLGSFRARITEPSRSRYVLVNVTAPSLAAWQGIK